MTTGKPPGGGEGRGRGPAPAAGSLWLQGDTDTLLQQALNALIHGNADAAADAARLALAAPDDPDRANNGWATWLLGLAHLYVNDATGAAPYLQRAQDMALQTQQPTLAMAVYLAQQLATSYGQQHAMRQHVTRLLKQLEDQEAKLTQQFQAMLKFARDSWPAMQGVATLPAGNGAPITVPDTSARAAGSTLALPPLQVQMLGPFRVLAGDREVTLRQSRKAADIFKFMLAHRPRPTPKDTLLHTLWPDVEVKTGTHRLHLAISSLRQMLGPTTGDGPGYIIFRDDAYFFNPLATVDTDVDRFVESVRQGQALDRAGRGAEAVAPYEAAAALYRDDFLVENLYDEWTIPTRTHLRETYLGMLAHLCDAYLQAARFEDCLQAARQMLAKDTYREDAHRYIMRALAATGRRNQALLQYQLCEETLGADLGVSPTAATLELYQQIKNEGD